MGVIGFAHHDRYCLFFERNGDMSVKVHLKLLRYWVDFEGKRSPQNALVPEPSREAQRTDERRNNLGGDSSVFLAWSRFSSPSSSKR